MQLTIFQWYLLGINVLAALLYLIDYLIYRRTGGELKPQVLLNMSTTFGGALGTLVVMLLMDRKLNKTNMLSRVYTVAWLLIQILIVLALYGPNHLTAAVWFRNFYRDHTALCIYLLGINGVTFLAFAIDKWKAMAGKWRTREVVLLGLSLIGGAFGGWMAMDFCNHKVRSEHFVVGIPMLMLVHVVVVMWVMIGIL